MEDINHQFFAESMTTIHDLQKNNILCDVILRGNSNNTEEVSAHRVVLASKSSYFQTMFTINMVESRQKEIILEGVNHEVLTKLVDYCYTGEIKVTPDDVEDVLEAAHMLHLQKVEQECFTFLSNNMNSSNCYGIQCLADKYSSLEIKRLVEDYTLKNFRFFMRSTSFPEVCFDQLSQLISNKCLNILCEGEVYEAVMKWVKHNTTERKKHLKELLHHVRFHMLTKKYLIDIVTKEELIIDNSNCREYLYNALDYHLVPERRNITSNLQIFQQPRVNLPTNIYVIGGENRTGSLNSCEVFNIREKCWNSCSPLTIARRNGAVVVLDGIIFCLGGIDDQGRDLSCVEKYDPSKDEWHKGVSMKQCKGALSAIILDGWLYAVGGCHGTSSLKCVERYDTIRREWTSVHQMRFPRSHFGVGLHGNKICAIGGYCGISEIEHCEVYDPISNKWNCIADLNKPRMGHGVVTTINSEKMFAVGGRNVTGGLDCIEKYNSALNMWLIVKHTLDPRAGSGILQVNEEENRNWLYILGGLDNTRCYHSNVKRINLKSIDYSIESERSMKEPRAYGGTVVL